MFRKQSELPAEAFTTKAYMKNAVVTGPSSVGILQVFPSKPTTFRRYYESRSLPVAKDYNSRGNKIVWKVDIERLDYQFYLPLFFDGLCETAHPYELLARQGIHEMLDCGGSRILPVLPHLIMPIRNALNTKNIQVMCTTMGVLQHLVMSDDHVGEALVPYLKQILPVFNLFKNKKKNFGAQLEADEKHSIGSLIDDTLQIFERYGGPDAFNIIKLMVPTYESCMRN